MTLNSILHVTITPKNEEIKRRIISINGLPFYQSSGDASTHTGTWFPFFGLQEHDNAFGRKGSFIKPFVPIMDTEILTPLRKYFPKNPYNNAMLDQRFGSRAGIVLSSWLGGGLWDTDKGKLLKAELEKLYPDFYQYWPQPHILTDDDASNVDVNTWLCQQAGVNDLLEIEPKIPSIDALIDRYKPKPNSKPEPKPILVFSNYKENTSNLGSIMNDQGERRSSRLKQKIT